MRSMNAAIVAVSASAMIVAAPLPSFAGARGHSVHAFHAKGHFRSVRHRHMQWPLYGYGGLYALPSGDMTSVPESLPVVFVVPEIPRVLNCRHSEEIKKVPAEDGGTREITITRC